MSTQQTVIDPNVCEHCGLGAGLHDASCPVELAAQEPDELEPAAVEVPAGQIDHNLTPQELAELTEFAEELGARLTAVPVARRGQVALARLLELRSLRPKPKRPTVTDVDQAPRRQDGSGQLSQPQRCGKRLLEGSRCIGQAGHTDECR